MTKYPKITYTSLVIDTISIYWRTDI